MLLKKLNPYEIRTQMGRIIINLYKGQVVLVKIENEEDKNLLRSKWDEEKIGVTGFIYT